MKGAYALLLLTIANLVMTLAWYGHLHKKMALFAELGLFGVILVSRAPASFGHILPVPAHRLGFAEHGGPFRLSKCSKSHHTRGIRFQGSYMSLEPRGRVRLAGADGVCDFQKMVSTNLAYNIHHEHLECS